ncbi:MAG: NAD-dependent epimerase/dehydratase family protein [Acidobacteria bacterium]|nr:NAD-dependent epimerase/dehydratase family protein [Acidobacteriota bacterium]
MSMMLVTGGTGFIGNHVVRRLCEEKFSVRVLARPGSRLACLESLPVEVVTGDLLDRPSLERAVEGCQAVFHVAADYRLWARDSRELYRNNVEGTEQMLAVASERGVSRFVYTSTVGTIGIPKNGSEGTEDSFPAPAALAGHYKRSKFMAEQAVLRYASRGYPVVVVNPTAPVGEGDWKPTPTGKIILDFLNRKIPAYLDTGLNWVDVRDVADGHLAAWVRGKPGERYILGGRNMSFKQLLDSLSKITGLPSPSFRMPYGLALCAAAVDSFVSRFSGKPPRVPWEGVRMARHKMYVSTAKAQRELGYQPGDVESALERAVKWFQNNAAVRTVQS